MHVEPVQLVVEGSSLRPETGQYFRRDGLVNKICGVAGKRSNVRIQTIAANPTLGNRKFGPDTTETDQVPVCRGPKCRVERFHKVIVENHVVFEYQPRIERRSAKRLPDRKMRCVDSHLSGQEVASHVSPIRMFVGPVPKAIAFRQSVNCAEIRTVQSEPLELCVHPGPPIDVLVSVDKPCVHILAGQFHSVHSNVGWVVSRVGLGPGESPWTPVLPYTTALRILAPGAAGVLAGRWCMGQRRLL